MAKGYNGRILSISASEGTFEIIEKDRDFYRTYPGGGSVGAWFILHSGKAEADPLSPENLFIISGSVVTGASVSGVSRCSVTSLSPLTGSDPVGFGKQGDRMDRLHAGEVVQLHAAGAALGDQQIGCQFCHSL